MGLPTLPFPFLVLSLFLLVDNWGNIRRYSSSLEWKAGLWSRLWDKVRLWSDNLHYQTLYDALPIIDKLSDPTKIFGSKMVNELYYQTVKSWYFLNINLNLIFWERRHFLGLLIGKVACDADVAGVQLLLTSLLLLASHNNPADSVVATDSDVVAPYCCYWCF